MARKTKEEKRIEKEADRLFSVLGNNIQFNIMDLGKLMEHVRIAGREGKDMEAAMKEAIAKYRQN